MAKKMTLAEKAKKAGLPVQTVYNRRHAGWSEKKALSEPTRTYKKKKVSYKVEPNEVQTPKNKGTHNTAIGRKPTVPLPVEKYEAPKDKTFLYVAVACAVLLAFALTAT